MAARKYIEPGSMIREFVYLGEAPDIGKERAVRARCKCGSEGIFRLTYLRNGHTKSCGCAKIEANRERCITHGHASRGKWSGTYAAYRDMMTRCTNPKYREFYLYGGRGIEVCERWRGNYENFLSDMGERPEGLTIERKNPDGNYEPSNCCWASRQVQQNNKRNSVRLTYNGKTQTVAQWAHELCISDKRIYYRVSKGWPPDRCLQE